MFPVITRKRLVVAAAIATATAGAATGTVLATRSSAASPPTSGTAMSPSPTPKAVPGAGHRHGLLRHGLRHTHMLVGRVTSVSSSSISLANYLGAVTTYSVSPKVRVVGPDSKPESLTSLPVGEIVIAVEVTRPAPAEGTASTTPTPQTTAGPATGTPVVVLIRDTGFKAS
jgi:hypothetical protein